MESPEPFIANQTWEKWMKLVKISTIAFAMSAMLAGPVLAQGVPSDTQIRGGAQGRSNMPGGASGSSDEDMGLRAGAPGEKSGVNAKAGAKGTVGSGSGAHKGSPLPPGDPAAGGRRN
jgi:hypothetical protein